MFRFGDDEFEDAEAAARGENDEADDTLHPLREDFEIFCRSLRVNGRDPLQPGFLGLGGFASFSAVGRCAHLLQRWSLASGHSDGRFSRRSCVPVQVAKWL